MKRLRGDQMDPIQKHTEEIATAITDLFLAGQEMGNEGLDRTFNAFAHGIGMMIGMALKPEDQGPFLIEFYQDIATGVMAGTKVTGRTCTIEMIVGRGEMPINKRF